jgi:hypothetical protein
MSIPRIVLDNSGFCIQNDDGSRESIGVDELYVVGVGKGDKLAKAYHDKTREFDGRPSCMSANGRTPSPLVDYPQADMCALCPQNQWQNTVNRRGIASMTKPCKDYFLAHVYDIYDGTDAVLTIPPSSNRIFREYIGKLAKYGLSFSNSVTCVYLNDEWDFNRIFFERYSGVNEETKQIVEGLQPPNFEELWFGTTGVGSNTDGFEVVDDAVINPFTSEE